MVNGIRLTGHVTAFDRHVVMLESLTGLQAVFKHAISTVMPGAVQRAPRPRLHEAGNRVKTRAHGAKMSHVSVVPRQANDIRPTYPTHAISEQRPRRATASVLWGEPDRAR